MNAVILIVMLSVVALFWTVSLFVFIQAISLTSSARSVGIRLGLVDYLGMKLRKARPKTIATQAIRAKKHGITLDLGRLETLSLIGASVENVTDALIRAKNDGIDLSFETAQRIELSSPGCDIIERYASLPPEMRREDDEPEDARESARNANAFPVDRDP